MATRELTTSSAPPLPNELIAKQWHLLMRVEIRSICSIKIFVYIMKIMEGYLSRDKWSSLWIVWEFPSPWQFQFMVFIISYGVAQQPPASSVKFAKDTSSSSLTSSNCCCFLLWLSSESVYALGTPLFRTRSFDVPECPKARAIIFHFLQSLLRLGLWGSDRGLQIAWSPLSPPMLKLASVLQSKFISFFGVG